MPLIFQYGSNCDADRLNSGDRLAGAAEDLGPAQTIGEYDIAFDVWSQGNGCGASDLLEAPGTARHAWGVLYEVPAGRIPGKNRPDGKKTLEEIEGPRYEEKPIRVRNEAGEEGEAATFLVKPEERREGLWTSADYAGHIVNGLRAHGVEEVDPAYIQHVIDTAIRTNETAEDRRNAEHQAVHLENLRHGDPVS